MYNSLVTLSIHAADKMEERFNLTEVEAKGLAARAWKKGKTFADYQGKARRYLLDLQTRYNEVGYIIKTYGNMFFIFSDTGVLCTAYGEGKLFQKLKSTTKVYHECDQTHINEELMSLGIAVAA